MPVDSHSEKTMVVSYFGSIDEINIMLAGTFREQRVSLNSIACWPTKMASGPQGTVKDNAH
jgi:hypothetical protein